MVTIKTYAGPLVHKNIEMQDLRYMESNGSFKNVTSKAAYLQLFIDIELAEGEIELCESSFST